MIYLKPVGGLCNRMRALESTVNLCKENNCNLTILWENNQDLNCSFEKLFKQIKEDNISVKFKEFFGSSLTYYMNKSILYKNMKFGFFYYLVFHLKKSFRNNNLDIYTAILLWRIKKDNFLLNKNLMSIYNSYEGTNRININCMDNSFIKKINFRLKFLLNNKKNNVFIESCFRIHPIKSNMSIFKPINNLNIQIESTVLKYSNTVGLHIRRTDHLISINKSQTSKFITIMEDILKKNRQTTFFLATDDDDVKQELIKKFSEKIITNNIESYNRNESNSIQNALIDLYCLSKTKKIYGSYHSTFSQMSAIIGEIDFITVA